MNTALILSAAVILAIAIVLPVFFGFGKKSVKKNISHKTGSLNKSFVQEKWTELDATFKVGGPSNMKTSIMEADKLVDYVLKNVGVAGETMGDRMKNARGKFGNYEDYNNLWYAHKVRNNIAHESDHDLVPAEARKTIDYYKIALIRLGAL